MNLTEQVGNIQLQEHTLKKIQAFFDSFEIKEIDENTISLCCNKNLLLAINGNYMELVKGENVKVGSPIHLNPVGIKYDSDVEIKEKAINITKNGNRDDRDRNHSRIKKYKNISEV